MSVTIDGVWTGNWIYWTLTDSWLTVFMPVSPIHTLCTSLEHTLKSSQPAVSSRLPTADVPLSLGSRTIQVTQLSASQGNSSQRLYCSSPLTDWLTDWLTHSLTHSLAGWLPNCCRPSPAQWFLVQSPTGLMNIFYSLRALGAFRPGTSDSLTD
jgi:hypothetical protein